MKTRKKTVAPRNPYVAAALQRKAGSHKKTMKALRQQAKRQLRAMLSDRPEKSGDTGK